MRIAALALVSAAALVLVGCTGSPQPTASPKPVPTPVFTSDADALAAAEKAYAAYESAVDRSLQTVSTKGLDAIATGDALATARSSVDSFKKDERTQRGRSLVRSVTPADLGPLTEPTRIGEVAQVYACLDVSKVEVLDRAGNPVSVAGRQTVFPTLVSLLWSVSRQKLLVSEESVWDGKNFCS